MSTQNYDKIDLASFPPGWAVSIPETEYHAAARSGAAVSSGLLKEFRVCPARYRDVIAGRVEARDSDALRLGRAAHKLLLEGDDAFARAFVVGGPTNDRTGRSFGPGSKAFDDWLRDSGLGRQSVLTPSEHGDVLRMREALRAHPEASSLLSRGWPELSARAEMRGLPCQARYDWLRPDGVAVDLKTTDDIARFEADARRFGYLHQFAFYRDVARAAGGVELDMIAVVLEKRPPHRVGVWHFAAGILEPYAVQNRAALDSLARCLSENRWPTGYEGRREFPLAGIPPVWLN